MYRQNTIHHGEDFVISPLEFSFKYAFFQRSSHMKCLPSPVDAWSRVRNRLEQQVMDGMRVILLPWLPRWDDDNGWTTEEYLWCDQAKWVWTKNKWKSSFKLYWRPHVQSYILLKTPSKLNLWFQRYGHFKCCSEQSNTKEIEGYYSLYLEINSSKFRLIFLDHNTFSEGSKTRVL